MKITMGGEGKLRILARELADQGRTELSPEIILHTIDAQQTWDETEPEVWKAFAENMGLDYDSYDDPDTLFSDLYGKVFAE